MLILMSDEELLNAFADYLDAALNMNLEAQILEILKAQGDRVALRCQRNAQQAFGLRLRSDAFFNAEQTKQKTLAVLKSYAASHPLRGMKRKDYCASYPERSFERAALGAFFGFLQILQATEVAP
jgi:hypothetical protein